MPHLLDQTLRQSIDVLNVQRIRRLIQRQYAAILSERVGERKPNDERSKHLLSSGTPSSHIHLNLVLRHNNLSRRLATDSLHVFSERSPPDNYTTVSKLRLPHRIGS
jgi:hypothetical protein